MDDKIATKLDFQAAFDNFYEFISESRGKKSNSSLSATTAVDASSTFATNRDSCNLVKRETREAQRLQDCFGCIFNQKSIEFLKWQHDNENQELRLRLSDAEQRLRKLEPANPQKTTRSENEGKDKGKSNDRNHQKDGISALSETSQCPTPKINRVEWAAFTSPGRFAAEKYTIDVLACEPVVYPASNYRDSWKYRHTKMPSLLRNNSPFNEKQSNLGKDPLPERLRINSLHIIRIFQKLDPETFGYKSEASDKHGQEPIVMIRPFRALVYFEDQLHHIHEYLLMRHNDTGSKQAPIPQELSQGNTRDGHRPRQSQPGEHDSNGNDGETTGIYPVDEVLNDKFTSSRVALEQLEILIQFLNTHIKPRFDYVRSQQCKKVAFSDLWYLFQPGDEVIGQDLKQAYRIIGTTSSAHKTINPHDSGQRLSPKTERRAIILHCVYVDCDGESIGPVPHVFVIQSFYGEKAITSLGIIPLRQAECPTDGSYTDSSFREKLITRGRMFTDILSAKHMHYSGPTAKYRDNVNGDVVVDFEKAFETDDSLRPSVSNLTDDEYAPCSEGEFNTAYCSGDRIHDDRYVELWRNSDYHNSLIPEGLSQQPSIAVYPRRKDSLAQHTLTDEDYVIMSYRAFGFILQSRKWAELDLTYLEYIRVPGEGRRGRDKDQPEVQETALEQIALGQGHKDLLLPLVAQHYWDKQLHKATHQFDLVPGKGKGLIILLHGAPGVGKTIIAEGIAEHFEKPLLRISCGALGTTAESVEHALETNFALASRWGCILLLDEADVFLAKRASQDFIRNGIVSVFLRGLEYYTGIMFLTTNRIGDLDEALGSRIHISLHCPQLELGATMDIFMINMRIIQKRLSENSRRFCVDQAAILQYVEVFWRKHKSMRWNGRQIRNLCQNALALAEIEAGGGSHKKATDTNSEVELRVDHLETVSRAYLEFMKYQKKLYKADHDRLAQKRGYRARELDAKPMHLIDDEDDALNREDESSGPIKDRPMPQQQALNSGLHSAAPLGNASSNHISSTPIPQLEALAAASQEPNSTSRNFLPNPFATLQQPQMAGYPQGFPQGYQQGGQAQSVPNFGFVPQFGSIPVMLPQQQQQQQQAQMWQNINPILWQQAMLQGQNPAFGAMPPGMPNQQSSSGGGAGTDSHKA